MPLYNEEFIRKYHEERERTKELKIISRQDLCRLRRRARSMTQEEYAEWCGVGVAVIRRAESDMPYNPCWTEEMHKKILGVSFDFINEHVDWLHL